LYDKLNYIIASQSCSGWTEYTAAYSKEVYSFALATIKVNDKNVTLLIDHENHRVVELIQTETGYVFNLQLKHQASAFYMRTSCLAY
jgi:hypothetical protein